MVRLQSPPAELEQPVQHPPWVKPRPISRPLPRPRSDEAATPPVTANTASSSTRMIEPSPTVRKGKHPHELGCAISGFVDGQILCGRAPTAENVAKHGTFTRSEISVHDVVRVGTPPIAQNGAGCFRSRSRSPRIYFTGTWRGAGRAACSVSRHSQDPTRRSCSQTHRSPCSCRHGGRTVPRQGACRSPRGSACR